jgi:folate-binding protein YgfZ
MTKLNSTAHFLAKNYCHEFVDTLFTVKGRDAFSFLQKMSTNDISLAKEQNCVHTSFVNSKGKLIDSCFIASPSKDEFLISSSHKNKNTLIEWLNKHHFIEELEIKPCSKDWQCAYLIGPTISEILKDLSAQSSHYFYSKKSCRGHNNLADECYFVIFPSSAEIDLPEIQDVDFERVKVALIIPSANHEICDRYLPNEAGLQDTISFEKGCYTGQEVISKAHTFQKRSRNLMGLIMDEEIFVQLILGSQVFDQNNQVVGKITSLSPSFNENTPSALAIIRADSNDFEVFLKTKDGESLKKVQLV